MKIRKLKLKGFRNLAPLELDFDDQKNILAFVGKNAQGKTNILEAIYLSVLSKSFRTQKNQELIQFGQEFSTIQVDTSDQSLQVIVSGSPVKKTFKINGVKKTPVDFIGQFKAVFFSPDDLAYMSFAPKLRRRYLDVLLSQLNHDYLLALIAYEEARKQRNALLKRIKNGESKQEELIFWDTLMAKHAPSIRKARRELVLSLNPIVSTYYRAIAQAEGEVKISYNSEAQEVRTSEAYLELLKRSYEADIASGKTNVGPQRDDLHFYLSDYDMHAFASRGEWRSLVLALKFAEIELLKQQINDTPILLLDDVFSELDEQRQKYLLASIGDIQTFITTTHQEFFDQMILPHQVYKVEKGKVTEA